MSEPLAPETFDVPSLGMVTRETRFGTYLSDPLPIPILGERPGRFILQGYAEDGDKAEFHAAIADFLRLDAAALRAADEPLFRYYKDREPFWVEEGGSPIGHVGALWEHVRLGHEPVVRRRAYEDQAVYVSLECECAWEPDHGLHLVFERGRHITKLGGYDGHLTNADAYGDPRLEDVIYHSLI